MLNWNDVIEAEGISNIEGKLWWVLFALWKKMFGGANMDVSRYFWKDGFGVTTSHDSS